MEIASTLKYNVIITIMTVFNNLLACQPDWDLFADE